MSERQGGGSMVASRVIAVPAGQIATIVTCLEMTAPPAPVVPVKSALKLERWTAPVDLDRYRALFRAIGQPWLWRGRLVMDDETLTATLNAPTLEVHVATRRDGTPQGLLELDFSGDRECELAYFGLVPELTGRGHGAWLMGHALKRAWREGIRRVWVHTCDLDHPGALTFYQRHGFRPYERLVEIYADPRASGLYPPETAPEVPLLRAET
ncbi:GNAT family N-acetyltransferase [Sandarakinorhabdus limnophila]|uniref:GNAT family N-acetyltransferase n=1 Tax=Sandarakinorhabdus limnophila TaxID=210512 RepID=UPI0003B42B79|nr:GNAT family N-acetyltransferase [Sandarakinorhabdus limnophila]